MARDVHMALRFYQAKRTTILIAGGAHDRKEHANPFHLEQKFSNVNSTSTSLFEAEPSDYYWLINYHSTTAPR